MDKIQVRPIVLQVYEVNAEYDESHFQSHISDSRISDSHDDTRSYAPLNSKSEDVTFSYFEQPTKHEYNISGDANLDPWDMIQMEKERRKQ